MKAQILQNEFVLNMYLEKLMIIDPASLEDVNFSGYFDESSPCQIYFIGKRPKVTVDPNSFRAGHDKIELAFKVHYKDRIEDFDFVFENQFKTSGITIESFHPYSDFSIKENNEILYNAKATAFLQSFPQEVTNADFLDLEILYIGQTYGIQGAGTDPAKLKSHQTLQGIYAAAVDKNPESEVCLLLASFQPHNLILTDGRQEFSYNDVNSKAEGDQAEIVTALDIHPHENITEQEIISITEAALIRYFEPAYNIEYKDIFLNPAQKTYSACYDLKIYSIGIELDTYDIANCHIYSQKAEPKWLHMKTYLLHSPEERKSIFDISQAAFPAGPAQEILVKL